MLSFMRKLDKDKYDVMVAYIKGEGKLAGGFRNAGVKVF